MKPGMAELLAGIAGATASRLIPAIDPESYATGDAKMIIALAVFLAQEVDRAADVLVCENAEMRRLFARMTEEKLPAELGARLAQAASGSDANLRISTLDPANAELRAVLIDLHIWAEEHSPATNTAIWDILKKSAANRALVMPQI
jgi:hypothetical protein